MLILFIFFLLIIFIGKDYFNLEVGRDVDEGWYDVLLTFDLVETKAKSCFCVSALDFVFETSNRSLCVK